MDDDFELVDGELPDMDVDPESPRNDLVPDLDNLPDEEAVPDLVGAAPGLAPS
jgi:hypothetical protein